MKSRGSVVVIGGGVSGLTAAHWLAGSYDVTVLEADEKLGGMLATFNVDGFRFDIGGHWLHHRGFAEMQSMFKGLVEHDRHALVCVEGKYGRYPIQTFYGDVYSPNDCKLIEQELEALQGGVPSSHDEMLRMSYGEKLYGTFFGAYNRKLFGRPDLTTIAPEARKSITFVKTGDTQGYNAQFLYPDGRGVYALINDLIDPNVRYLLNKKVTVVDTDERAVVCSDGSVYEYDIVISTMPLDALLRATGLPQFVEVADGLQGTAGRILNLGVKWNPVHAEKTWVYYSDMDLPFYRVGLYSEPDPSAAPEGHSAMYVEVSTLQDWTYEEIVDGLVRVGMLEDPSDVVVQQELLLPLNYCLSDEHSEKALVDLKLIGVNSIGRYGSWRWSSIHENIVMALELAMSLDQ